MEFPSLPRLKEISRDRREQGERQFVLRCGGRLRHVLPQLVKFGVQPVRGPAFDRFLVANGAGHDFLIERSRCPTVESQEIVFSFGGDDLVPLTLRAGQHVERGLRADDLAGRRHERGITHLFAHTRDFVEHFLHAIDRILLGQLRRKVR